MSGGGGPIPRWVDVGLIPLINLSLAFLVSGLVVLAIGEDPFKAMQTLVLGAVGDGQLIPHGEAIGYTLYYTTNFVFPGLAVAVAFHCGLFNIGGEGQAYIGGLGVGLVCLYLDFLPFGLIVLAAVAVGGAFGTFREIEPAVLQHNFDVNAMALLRLAQLTTPAMVEAGEGALIVTGNTSALRGKAKFAGFAPTKAAQRILAESLARDLGPRGVHVAYLVIDAVIDVPWAREQMPEAPDNFFIQPASIAAEVFHLAHQPRDAWSFLAEVRPFHEPW